MKLEIGKADYAYSHPIREAAIRGRIKGKDVPLIIVDMKEMEERHEQWPNMRATPAYIAHDAKAKKVWLHPLPSGEYELDITRELSGTITLPKSSKAAA